MDYMKQIPPEIWMEILYKLDPNQVKQSCTLLNTKFGKKVCTPFFWNLYAQKNGVWIYLYQIKENKFLNLGQYYQIMGYDNNSIVMMNLKGNLVSYDSIDNFISKFNLKDVSKYIVDVEITEDYYITTEGDFKRVFNHKTIFTKLDHFKIKNVIMVHLKSVILYQDGSLYYNNNYNENNSLILIKKGVEQIYESLDYPDVIILNQDGSISLYRTDDRSITNMTMPEDVKFKTITPNLNSTIVFGIDQNDTGWFIDIKKLELTSSKLKLKQGLIFKIGIFVGLDYDGKIKYQGKLKIGYELKLVDFKSPIDRKVRNIYNINDNLVIEYWDYK